MKLPKVPFFIFFLVFSFQFSFGLYYAVTEHRKGAYFDPLQSSESYFQRQILEAWQAPRAGGDIEAYHRAAYSIATEGRLANANGEPSAWVTPGFPLVVAAIYSIFGYRFFAVLVFNALCVTLAYAFLARLARRSFSPAAGIVAALLLFANLRMSMFVGYVYTESLFVLIVAATLAWTYDLSQRPFGWRVILGLGFLSGFGILVRPVFLGLVPLVAIFLFLSQNGVSRRRRALTASIYAGTALLCFAGWIARNQLVLGRPLVTTSSVYAFAEGNQDFYRTFRFGDLYRNSSTQTPYGPLPEVGETGNLELDRALTLGTQVREWRAANSGFYAWLVAWRLKTLSMPYTADMSERNRAVSLVIWLLIFPAALVGWVLERRNRATWLVGIGGFALLAMPAFVVVGPSLRYQIPAQLLFSLLAASAYARGWGKRASRSSLPV